MTFQKCLSCARPFRRLPYNPQFDRTLDDRYCAECHADLDKEANMSREEWRKKFGHLAPPPTVAAPSTLPSQALIPISEAMKMVRELGDKLKIPR